MDKVLTRLFVLVGDDATHEVGMGAVQVLHQLVQRLLLYGKDPSEHIVHYSPSVAVHVFHKIFTPLH